MKDYLLPLQKIYQQHADKTKAEGAKAYMLNQFEFYGIVMARTEKTM